MSETEKIIGFPGLFDFKFKFDRVAFTIGESMPVYWYGIIICIAIIAAFMYFLKRGVKCEHLIEDDLLNIAIFTIPVGIIGARAVYVLTNLSYFTSFSQIFAINKGGIAIYGGIIFGLVTVWVYCRKKKINVMSVLDSLAPGVMLGQIIGRWGNYFNGEAYGMTDNVNEWFLRMSIEGVNKNGSHYDIVVHPTFLYESLWNLVGFIIINIIYKKKKFNGEIFLMYAAWYGLGRGLIEIIRTDSCLVFGHKIFVYLGLISAIVCIPLILCLRRKNAHKENEIEQFRKEFGNIVNSSTEATNETTADDEVEQGSSVENKELDNKPSEDDKK